jgi:hypothetical protein
MTSDINHPLRHYLGTDDDGGYQPSGCDDRLRVAFPNDYDRIVELLAPYLDEEHAPEDWTGQSLAEEAGYFVSKLQTKFPELDDLSIKGLANRWSFDWR